IYSISSLYNYIIVAPSATLSVAIPSTFISAAASAFSDVVRNPLSAAAVVFSSTVRSSLSAGTTRSSRCFMPLFVLLHLDTPFTLVRLYSSISVGSHVDWYEMIVVWVSPNIWIMVLNCNVPVTFGSFGSDVVQLVVFLSPSCDFPQYTYGGFSLPGSFFVRLFFFPIFPPLWSELDAQASLVCLMLFFAYVAVFVTSQVTQYAFIQEGYGIVVQFLMFFSNEVYRHSIICLINVSVCLALSSFDVSSLGGVKLC
ncbi:hypothetical protein HID58_025335, partial [Brassica napus]